jgi:hypothetical protein
MRNSGVNTDTIPSLDADGFTAQVGADSQEDMNASGVTYNYIAFNQVAGKIKVGEYTGNGSDNRDITGVGFQPEYVLLQTYNGGDQVIQRSDQMTGDNSIDFYGALTANRIQSLLSDGFQVGNDARVNQSDTPDEMYAYVAFNMVDSGLCAFNYLAPPFQDVTPNSTGSWVDVDVSATVPAGATGVILQVVNNTGAAQMYGVRYNGQTSETWMYDTLELKDGTQRWLMIGLDSSRIFECRTNSTSVETYLIGYTGPGVTFFQQAVDKNVAAGSEQTVDISSNTGTDTAIGAIFMVNNQAGTSQSFYLQHFDSTDDHYQQIRADTTSVYMTGVDSSERAHAFIENATNVTIYLQGYITSGAHFFTNAVDKSTATTGNYADVDITADLQGQDDASGAILEVLDTDGNERNTAFRNKDWTSYDYYYDTKHQGALVAVDDNDVFEQKIEWDTHDVYLVGYTTCSGGSGPISRWEFSEGSGTTAGDSAGSNDGTLAGPTNGLPSWTCTSNGYALDFDGDDDEVTLPGAIIGDSAAWTVSAWIKIGADTADQRTIYSEGDSVANEYWLLYVDDSTDKVKFWSIDGSITMTGTTSVEDDAWHKQIESCMSVPCPRQPIPPIREP